MGASVGLLSQGQHESQEGFCCALVKSELPELDNLKRTS